MFSGLDLHNTDPAQHTTTNGMKDLVRIQMIYCLLLLLCIMRQMSEWLTNSPVTDPARPIITAGYDPDDLQVRIQIFGRLLVNGRPTVKS